MNKNSKFCEYEYKDNKVSSGHPYLFPVLIKLIPGDKRLRILDLGCGNGSLSHLIAKRGHEVTGIDSSSSGVDIARRNFSDCNFIQADIHNLPYEALENSFDIVMSVEAIEHLRQPRALIEAAKRCLKPDGRFILTTPYHGYFKNLALSILNKWDKHFNVLWDAGHIRFFSVRTLSLLLKEGGFENFRFKPAGRFPCFSKSMVCYSTPARAGLPISVIILTYNGEKHIEGCLKSIKDWADEVFIVDSGSRDKTLDIAECYTSKIHKHPYENYAKQRNWAQEALPVKNDWVFHLDQDERVTPRLLDELKKLFSNTRSVSGINGFLIPRKTVFMGRWIRHGGQYPTYQLRLFRRDSGMCEDRIYNQHFIVRGKVSKLKGDIVDLFASGLTAMIELHNASSSSEAMELMRGRTGGQLNGKLFGSPIEKRRWLRNKFYRRFPIFLRAFLYFIYRYFARFGFLDGTEGLIFHFLQGFWVHFVIDAKIWEYDNCRD